MGTFFKCLFGFHKRAKTWVLKDIVKFADIGRYVYFCEHCGKEMEGE